MIPMRDVTGRRSRTMDTGQAMILIGMVQAMLAVNGLPIPEGYEWVIGIIQAALGSWIIYLRQTTTTQMGP